MNKKDYMKPTMKVVKLHTAQMIALSNANTTGLSGEGLGYDKNGGNQGSAWSRGNDGWDDDDE